MNLVYDIVLIIISLSSITLSGVLVWYVRKLLMKMALLADLQKETSVEIEEYSEHLKAINEMELFYGDETLAALLEHTETLRSSLLNKVESVDFLETPEEEQDDDDQE